MKNHIEVAIGTPYPLNPNNIKGGIEAVSTCLINSLSEIDEISKLHIVSCSEKIKKDKIEYRGKLIYHWVAVGQRFGLVRSITTNRNKLHKIYKKINPSIIHAQGCSEYALAAPKNIPLIVTIHGVEVYSKEMRATNHFSGFKGLYRYLFLHLINKSSIRKADAIVSIAGNYVEQIVGEELVNKKIFHIPNPVDEIFFEQASIPEINNRILFVGSVIERKNLLTLFRALFLVQKFIPDVNLKIAGPIVDKSYFNQLLELIKETNVVNHIDFLGQLDQKSLIEEYDECCCFVLPSIQETAPMVVAQAMAKAKPVIASKVAGIPWMIGNDGAGILIDPRNENQLADSIMLLLNNPQKRQVIGRAAKERALKLFSPQSVIKQTIQVYNEITKEL